MRKTALLAAVCLGLLKCTEIEMTPSPLTVSAERTVHVLHIDMNARTASDYPDVFAPGSRWQEVGVTARGTVMRPLDGGLSLKGIDAREGYAVVDGDRLVGYWLPYEQAFTPAKNVVRLHYE